MGEEGRRSPKGANWKIKERVCSLMKDAQEIRGRCRGFDPFPLHFRTSKLSTSTFHSQQHSPSCVHPVTKEHLGHASSVSEPEPGNDIA